MKKIPNPGSDEALKLGCSCAVLDNAHGQGFNIDGKQCFWVTETCKLHGRNPEDATKKLIDSQERDAWGNNNGKDSFLDNYNWK